MAAKMERAHQMYRDGQHAEALAFYTEALASAKTNPQKIALHSHRAACYLKLHDLRKAAEECTSVLELDHQHTGALMLRAQTLVTLKEYQSALFDFNRLIELNPLSDVYKNLQARLRTQLSLAPIPESEEESLLDEDEDEGDDEELEEDNGHENEISIQRVDEKSESTWKQSDFKVIHPLNGENLNRAKVTSSTAVCNTGNVWDVGNTKVELKRTCTPLLQIQKGDDGKGCSEDSTHAPSKRWETIPKPKGHSGLDYSKWDSVEDDSSEEDDDDDEQPQYRFRVRTIGIRPVK